MSYRHTHGARLVAHDVTLFSLWAPDARQVDVELEDGSTHGLKAANEGWYHAQVRCGAGTGYRFFVDQKWRVPDPASRSQREDLHGLSQVVDHDTYTWQTSSWTGRPWHESIICEIHVGLLGGFRGVTSYLPYFRELGITALQLMPVAQFPGARNWGYDGALLYAPHSAYGTPEDLKALIDAAHAHEIMIFLDMVYNHFGPEGNYLGHYASEYFCPDRPTPWGAAINFQRPQVRDFFVENALMWLQDYRVDGLRFDAVHAITDTDFLVDLALQVRESVDPQRHTHLIVENERNAAGLLECGFDAQWNDDGHHILHTILTGERDGYYADFSDDKTGKLAKFLSEGFIYQGNTLGDGTPRGEPSAHLSATSFVMFLQNHDQIGNRAFGERLLTLAPEDKLTAAVALLLLSPMVPMIFMGEECGSRHPFLYFTDHHEDLAKAVREGRAREFGKFQQFAGRERELPDPNAEETFNSSRPYRLPPFDGDVCAQGDPSWYRLYRELLMLRRTHIMPWLTNARSGGATRLGEHAVAASWLLDGDRVLRVHVNLGDTRVPFTAPEPQEETLFSFGLDPLTRHMTPGSIIVRLQEAE